VSKLLGNCVDRILASPAIQRWSLLVITSIICTVHADGGDRLTARLDGGKKDSRCLFQAPEYGGFIMRTVDLLSSLPEAPHHDV
jgi:hypothetical protein